jgi:hypothetical protein
LARLDAWGAAGRQQQVDPRAEADEAVDVARAHLVARHRVAHDPPRHEARDLEDDQVVAVGAVHPRRGAGVGVARRGQVGREVAARAVLDGLDLAVERDPLDVHVVHGEEDADARARTGRQPERDEVLGRLGGVDQAHGAVGGGDRDAGTSRRGAVRCAEERGHPGRDGQPAERAPAAQGAEREGSRGDGADHRRPARVQRRQGVAHEGEGVAHRAAGGRRGRDRGSRVGGGTGGGVVGPDHGRADPSSRRRAGNLSAAA